MPEPRRFAQPAQVLQPGSRVAFTSPVDIAGRTLSDPAELAEICAEKELILQEQISAETTALVVADPSAVTLPVELAERYGTAVITAEDFSGWLAAGREVAPFNTTGAVDNPFAVTAAEPNPFAPVSGQTPVPPPVPVTEPAQLVSVMLQGKDFTVDAQESEPAKIIRTDRAAILDSEDELLEALMQQPDSLPVAKKTAKGQGQKTIWALVLTFVFFASFGESSRGSFFENLFFFLMQAHFVLACYHFGHMMLRLVTGPKYDLDKTRMLLSTALKTPLADIAVLYTDRRSLNWREYQLVSQFCGLYNFLQLVHAPMPVQDWHDLVDEGLSVLGLEYYDNDHEAQQVADTINHWIDRAAAEGIDTEEFAARGIDLAHARQGESLD